MSFTSWAWRALLATAALLLLAGLAAQLLFFESLVVMTLQSSLHKQGIALELESASGSLFAGRASLRALRLERSQVKGVQLQLRIAELDFDLSLASLLSGPLQVDSLRVQGVSGTLSRRQRAARQERRRPVVIRKLELVDVGFEYMDAAQPHLPSLRVHIERGESDRVRTQVLLLDLLLRSRARGTLDDTFLSIDFDAATGRSEWQAEALPVTALGVLVGGPLAWLQRGRMDIQVESQWSGRLGDDARVHWKSVVRDLYTPSSEELSLASLMLLRALRSRLDKDRAALPLDFAFEIAAADIQAFAGGEVGGLLRGAQPALLKALLNGAQPARMRERATEAVRTLRQRLQ